MPVLRSGPAADERALLVDLLRDVGPDADTLCEGWDARMLAAHLVARETKPAALAGILVSALHPRTERIERQTAESRSFAQLTEAIAAGPPFGLVAPDAVNVHEFFVHHEDVRRAQPGWAPRTLPRRLEDALRRRLLVLAPALFRRVRGVRLHLVTPDGPLRTIGHGKEEVTLTGPVSELFLYAFGRRDAAQVRIDASPAGRTLLEGAPLGL